MKKLGLSIALIIVVLGSAACSKQQVDLPAPQEIENQHSQGPEESQKEDPMEGDAESSVDEIKEEESTSTDISTGKQGKQHTTMKQDVIQLEGSDEEFTFILYEDKALGFKTYVVEDFLIDQASSGEGDVFVAKANFGGKLNEDARLSIFSPQEMNVSSIGEMTQLSKEINEINGFTIKERSADAKKLLPISEAEYHIEKRKKDGATILGTVSVFSKNNRYYMLTMQYPEEYAEGFVPRVLKLVEDTVWYK